MVTSEVMCKVALGLGHAVMALRAVQKGSSPNIAATLYVTASTMFEEASKTYREQQQGKRRAGPGACDCMETTFYLLHSSKPVCLYSGA